MYIVSLIVLFLNSNLYLAIYQAGDDDRRGGRGRDNDRYSGPTSEFKEKEGYKPTVSLEYVDDEGRKLCSKEAFR